MGGKPKATLLPSHFIHDSHTLLREGHDMKIPLSRRARIWFMTLLLAGAGLVFVIARTFAPSRPELREPQPEENLDRTEPVAAPVAEAIRAKPQPVENEFTAPIPGVAKLGTPTPPPLANPAETPKDGGIANGGPLKSMRGLIKWMSGTVGTAPSGTK